MNSEKVSKTFQASVSQFVVVVMITSLSVLNEIMHALWVELCVPKDAEVLIPSTLEGDLGNRVFVGGQVLI